MNAKDVAALVDNEIAAYLPALTTQETVGQRFSLARELEEVALLRANLLLPSKRQVVGDSAREVWVVAKADEYIVFLDANRREFGLGFLEPDGAVRDIDLYGDLVGTFMAR